MYSGTSTNRHGSRFGFCKIVAFTQMEGALEEIDSVTYVCHGNTRPPAVGGSDTFLCCRSVSKSQKSRRNQSLVIYHHFQMTCPSNRLVIVASIGNCCFDKTPCALDRIDQGRNSHEQDTSCVQDHGDRKGQSLTRGEIYISRLLW